VTALTAGAVFGSLVSTSPHDSVAAAAPVVVPAGPESVMPVTTDDMDRRLVRSNRGTQRVALTDDASSSARGKALLTQAKAMAKEEAKLKKEKAAEAKKKKAEAKKKKAEAEKRAEEKKEKEAAEARAKKQGYDPDTTSPKSIARQIMKNKYGWGAKQFSCYNDIIMRESAWKITADNPTSSAYGIPQALPGSKMASEGSDWRTNPATQIKWGLGYVKSRYGTPCEAWGFKSSHGWY
jgi:murein DD-endopeptidase MepM/ murein hydrolase activator NlpD